MPITFRHRANYWCRLVARFVLVLACVTYAAAKFTGAQFVIPGYLLDSPVTDLGGMDLFRRLRALRPGMEDRLLFMTGGALSFEAEAFLAQLPGRWLEKPFDLEILEERLRQVQHSASPAPGHA